eukprot:2663641-Prymnesium_polylepis.1
MWHGIESRLLTTQPGVPAAPKTPSPQRQSAQPPPPPPSSSAPLVERLVAVMYHAHRRPERRCFPLSILWDARVREAVDEVQYALLRERFIATAGEGKGSGSALPPDFDFSGYLRRTASKRAAEILEVSVNTWWVLIGFIIV